MPKKGYQCPPTQTKPKGIPQVEQKWGLVSSIPETVPYLTILNRGIQELKKIIMTWSLQSQYYLTDMKERTILCEYIRCYHEYTEYDQFDSDFTPLTQLYGRLQRIKDPQLIYKSFNLFKNCKWPIRFNSKFISRFNDCTISQMKYILSFVLLLGDGHFIPKQKVEGQFGYARPILTARSFPYNRFFTVKCFRQKNMLIHIGVEKIPIVTRYSNVIKRYEFINYIQFLDILGDQIVENPKKLDERLKLFVDKILQDVAKRDHSDELQIEPAKYSKYQHYFFKEEINPYNDLKQVFEIIIDPQVTVYLPVIFKVYYASSAETSTLIFDRKIKRWISQDFLDQVERKKLNEYQRKINQELVKRFVDFQSAKILVELLTKIPNFKVKLTNQQKDVIGENGNVMVIGRSGTGKTTCAVLRLFSIEMLFKIRLSLYKKKFQSQIANTRCSSDDIDQAIGLHCIFLTASPVLTNEIQRYYKKLTDNIKQELEKKKKKVEQEKRLKQKERKLLEQQENAIKQEQHEDDSSYIQNIEPEKQKEQKVEGEKMQEKQDSFEEIRDQEVPNTLQRAKSKQVIEQEIQMNQQLKNIELKQDVENEDFNEDEQDFDQAKEQFEEKIKKYHSLEDLEEKDYPGFFTVKSYIMMIDGTLKKPFFIRGKGSNEIIEQQSAKSAWHNQRRGVMMIENYYKNEENDQNQPEINENLINEIEEEINYSDEEELEHEYMRQIQLKANKEKQQLTKKLAEKKKKNLMSFEVDFDFFCTHFWPNVNRKFYCSRIITPQLVWTEIYSTIKGSASSHTYPGQYMPEKVYLNQSQNVFLTKDQKLDIYETFCQYERWKIKAGGYDIMDAVNYILNFMRFRGYSGPQIHYVMIDEVQDLPHGILYLLSKTALYGVFYSGDTAQTIAKGVGFRFCDLKSLFDPRLFDASLELKKPIVKHLTVNFRSHNNILQLANSIVSSLQILFPKTIDKLAKERSDLEGPKPMILAQNDEQMLFYVLCGQDQSNKANQNDSMKKPPLQFGCDQVIIVRDQQSKERVPNMLQHALCLTIYEAKGLQFNDVILFNFFTECKHPEKWSLLKYLKVIDEEISKQDYEKNLTKHKQEENLLKAPEEKQVELIDSECIVEQKDETIKIKKIVSDIKKIMKDINDYAELCSDLKLLYTAITRPRKTLIIYDEDPNCRKVIEKMWENLGIIQIVTKNLIEEEALNPSSNTSIFKKVVQATDKNEWKKQGLKMYSRGYFEQAMKCFQRGENQDLYKKAKANLLADRATKSLIEVESQRNSVKQGFLGYKNLSSTQISRLKKKLKQNESRSHEQFNEAGMIFESLLMFKQAGQCYFSGKKYQKSRDSFMKINMFKQAAQSLQMLQQYEKAAQLYDKEGDYLKVIECLDLVNEWEQILKVIKKYEQKMSEVEKSSLLKKYASLALQELVYEIEFENQQQQTDQNKKQANDRIEVIQEKQSDEEDQGSSESQSESSEDSDLIKHTNLITLKQEIQSKDPQLEAQQSYKMRDAPIIKQVCQKISNEMQETIYQKIQKPQEIDQSVDSFAQLCQNPNEKSHLPEEQQQKQQIIQSIPLQITDSFDQIDSSKIENSISLKNQQKPKIKEIESSFSDLNSSSGDFSQLNAKYEKQLEPDIESIKSLADPEDPWIKSAISQINPKSQYSIIDQDESYNMNVKIIKTKGNIFIQDKVMQKIIRIVSIINSSSTTFLQQFKGYQSLITINKTSNPTTNQQNQINNNQITDFQDIDTETINIVLDTLESFKLYKLCLFVCNRYHLPEKAGRYLVSIMMRYATNCQSNTMVSSGLLAPSTQRKAELQKGILGSIAVHSVLENVNSQFLKVKVSSNNDQKNQKNTLGTYFIQGLILEGFYKKTVFITDPQEALKILNNFLDYVLYRDIYKNKFLKLQNEESHFFLTEKPTKQLETNFAMITLREVIKQYQSFYKFDMISYRFYNQFGHVDKSSFFENLRVPDYLPFTKNIIAEKEDLHQFLDKELPLTYKKLTNGNQLETTDIVFGLLSIIYKNSLEQELFERASLKSFLEFYRCIKHIKNIVHHLDGQNSLNIIRAILYFYQCKLIENSKSMNFLGSGYCFLSRTSYLANDFIEEVKNNPEIFAYFFEQDFNHIMAKVSTLMKFIQNKFDTKLTKFLKNRIEIHRFRNKILPDDYALHTQELVIINALRQAVNLINSKEAKQTTKLIKKRKKDNIIRPKFDYKTHGKIQTAYIFYEEEISEEEEPTYQNKYTLQAYVLPSFLQQMTYLKDELLSIFNKKIKQSQQTVIGHDLYCSNLNSYYREYVQKIGGFNLYDAIEFKKFKRIDLYADNILSVIDRFPLVDKHTFLAEIMVLLLIQYKKLTENTNKFTLLMRTSYLKFLEDLKVVKCLGQKLKTDQDFENINSDDLHESITADQKKFMFTYNYEFVSETSSKLLMQIICDYLGVLMREESSQFVNLYYICQLYVINIKPTEQNFKLYERLRKAINLLGKVWDKQFYQELIKAKNHQQFLQIRTAVLRTQKIRHNIEVTCTGNVENAIEESERDYQIQTRIINGRKKALGKILSWWKVNKITHKDRSQRNIHNYFDYLLKNQDQRLTESSLLYKNLNDFRMFEKISDCNLSLRVPLIFAIQQTREDLLKFYLKHTVSSSLDFHYILMTLRKIEGFKQQYISICKQLERGIIERDIENELSSLSENIEDLVSSINIWKKDEKWLKEKNLSLKKKKVFEVKWMRKSLNQMKIIRKRAGLKKQQKLQQKKKFLKG